MIIIQRSALLPYSNEKMFALVNDIESYPQYMDGCVKASVLSYTDNCMEARLELRKAGISQSFATRNRLEKPERIVMELSEGPFDVFQGEWQFRALAADACKVSLDLQFRIRSNTFASGPARQATEKLFESVAGNLVNALCQRARQLHG